MSSERINWTSACVSRFQMARSCGKAKRLGFGCILMALRLMAFWAPASQLCMPKIWSQGLAISGLVSGAAVVLTPTPSHAAKRKRNRRRGRRSRKRREKADPNRQIRREKGLAPKEEYGLSDEVAKTQDIGPQKAADGPSLGAEELKVENAQIQIGQKLDEEIEYARNLLEFETECADTAPVMFRLADLYWEKSKQTFFKVNDFENNETRRKRYARLMGMQQQRSITYYEKILETCHEYPDYAKTLFYLGRAQTELENPEEGAAYFKRVIQEYPDSEWVVNSWFMIGEYHFNVANDAYAALDAYTKATEFPGSTVLGLAVYKQGWCHINTGNWPDALAKFREVVAISWDKEQRLDEKGRRALRKEALKDYVRAYSHVGTAKRALADFRRIGRKEAAGMMERLGDWYARQGANQDVAAIYRALIDQYPDSTRLPLYQGRIVDAASRLGDRKGTVEGASKLAKFFVDVRKTLSQSEDPEVAKRIGKDIVEAEEIAENTLRRLALEYHKEAKKLRGSTARRGYRNAERLYRDYLRIFPEAKEDSEVNYVFFMRFYYAEVLFKLENFLGAAKNYSSVVAMNPSSEKEKERKIVLIAAEEAVRSYDELVQDMDRANPPVIGGTKEKKIPKIKEDLIAACRRYIDIVGSVGPKIVEIRYKMARIYYTYNHFDQAAPAFDDIVNNHPESDVACYAANLALDIYNGRKNYRALKDASRSYLDNATLACGDEDRTKFAKIEEQSSFLLIKSEFEDKARYISGAEAYLEFYDNYPKSKFADDAIYNAAVNFDLGNRLGRANEVRRFLVEKIPTSPLVPETMYNIAQSYERIVDFEKAADYLELFANKYPKDKRSKDARYNAGLYYATLGLFSKSEATRDAFVSQYPSDSDVGMVAFSKCETLEEKASSIRKRKKSDRKPGDLRQGWEQAHDCYYKFVQNKDYVSKNPDNLCQAQFRRGEIMKRHLKQNKGAQEQRRYLLKSWPRWLKKHGIEKLPRCAQAVAETSYDDLEGRSKRYASMKISELNPTEKGKKRFDASITAKTAERDKLVGAYRKVAEIGVAKWALAALFRIGDAYDNSIESLLGAKIPDEIPGYKLSEEDKSLLRNQLKEMAGPIEGAAVEAYEICVRKANALGAYTQWSVEALMRLQKLRPDAYPKIDERIRTIEIPRPIVVATNGILVRDGDVLGEMTQKLLVQDSEGSQKSKSKENADPKAVSNQKGGAL